MNAQLGGTGTSGQAIWQREIESDRIANRWRKFLLFFVAPTAAVLVIGLLVGGVGAFLGLGILLGLFGLLLWGLVFFKNLGAKQNATIERHGNELVCGRRRIDLTRVESWTTQTADVDWGVSSQILFGNPMAGNAITARLVFRLAELDEHGHRGVRPDGGAAYELVGLAWAEMPADHLDRLRQAIAPHIGAPHVTAEQLRI
ncbi:MAG: hypothetical protein AB8G26_00800 [Ilumatobacter sp.]